MYDANTKSWSVFYYITCSQEQKAWVTLQIHINRFIKVHHEITQNEVHIIPTQVWMKRKRLRYQACRHTTRKHEKKRIIKKK